MDDERVIFEVDDYHIIDNVGGALIDILNRSAKLPDLTLMYKGNGGIISGDMTAWRELFASGSLAGAYFIGHFAPEQVRGFGYIDEDAEPDPRVHRISNVNLGNQPTVNETADQEVQ